MPADAQMAWWKQPVFDDKELDKIVKKGLKRLYDFQHDDGGWAWWKWGDSDPYMTAYVLIGLVEARNAGFSVDKSSISRGMKFLGNELKKMNKKQGTSREVRSFLGYALSLDKKVKYKDLKDLYEHRESMSHYGQALIALAVHNIGEKDKAKEAVGNLIDVAWVDKKNKTASFKFTQKGWWRWWNNRVETVAWALRAVMTVEPSHKVGDYFAKWLMLNRQGNHWNYRVKINLLFSVVKQELFGLKVLHARCLAPCCIVSGGKRLSAAAAACVAKQKSRGSRGRMTAKCSRKCSGALRDCFSPRRKGDRCRTIRPEARARRNPRTPAPRTPRTPAESAPASGPL